MYVYGQETSLIPIVSQPIKVVVVVVIVIAIVVVVCVVLFMMLLLLLLLFTMLSKPNVTQLNSTQSTFKATSV